MDYLPVGTAIVGWQGPLGSTHDFDFGGRCVEVKSWATPLRPAFSVANLFQLDETRVDLLLLFHVVLDPTGGTDGETLPELIDRIRTHTGGEDPAALGRLDELLIRTGYLDAQAALYANRRFRVARTGWFRVAGDFPRIRPVDVRNGVVSATCQISLDACAPFALNGQEALQLLDGNRHG